MGSSIYVTITTRVQETSIAHMDIFRALVEDTNRLLMVSIQRAEVEAVTVSIVPTDYLVRQKGVILPIGHYPVSDPLHSGRTVSSSTTLPSAGGDFGGESMENTASAGSREPPQSLPGGIALADIEPMHSGPM